MEHLLQLSALSISGGLCDIKWGDSKVNDKEVWEKAKMEYKPIQAGRLYALFMIDLGHT